MAHFTEEQIAALRMNKNIIRITEYSVSFTPEFQQYAYEQKKKGRRLADIFREKGIDPAILGEKRILNFSQKLNKSVHQATGFLDQRNTNGKQAVQEANMSLEEQVKWLRHELEYTRQEVEFLKKLQMANTEAREAWESKHRPK